MRAYPQMPLLEWVQGSGVRPFEPRRYRNATEYDFQGDIIPEGFEFDGMSAPTPCKPFISEAAEYSMAAFGHDWDYCRGISKEIADAKFHERLKTVDKVRHFDYAVCWAILILVGFVAYNDHRSRGHSATNYPGMKEAA